VKRLVRSEVGDLRHPVREVVEGDHARDVPHLLVGELLPEPVDVGVLDPTG